MTTLIAHHDGERGWMASDRRVNSGSEVLSDTSTKIHPAGKWLIGVAGAQIAHCIVDAHLENLTAAETPWELSRALKLACETEGYTPGSEAPGKAPLIDNSFLVVSAEGQYTIFYDFCIVQQDRPCMIGSGGEYAGGALVALLGTGTPIAEAMRKAVAVGIYFDGHSGGEPDVRSIGPEGAEP